MIIFYIGKLISQSQVWSILALCTLEFQSATIVFDFEDIEQSSNLIIDIGDSFPDLSDANFEYVCFRSSTEIRIQTELVFKMLDYVFNSNMKYIRFFQIRFEEKMSNKFTIEERKGTQKFYANFTNAQIVFIDNQFIGMEVDTNTKIVCFEDFTYLDNCTSVYEK